MALTQLSDSRLTRPHVLLTGDVYVLNPLSLLTSFNTWKRCSTPCSVRDRSPYTLEKSTTYFILIYPSSIVSGSKLIGDAHKAVLNTL